VLGWRSKWKFVRDKVPFSRGGRHAAFLREAFAKHLFTPEDLNTAVEQAVRGYGDAIAGVENQMLVRIRADLVDLARADLPEFSDQAELVAAYDIAMKRAVSHIGTDVTADVATLLVSLIAEEVLAQAAVRMGVSAGLLGAGAGTSWATFGAGLVVALIVDQLITWVWDWWSDPRGDLAAELNIRLDELHDQIVEGDTSAEGLRPRLAEFARQRASLRREAVFEMLGAPQAAKAYSQ
jgi:hypothetical protein